MSNDRIMKVLPIILLVCFFILFFTTFVLLTANVRNDFAPILGLGAVVLMMLLWIVYPRMILDLVHGLGYS